MHESGNLIFVAAVDAAICKAVEDELIWQGRRILTYNNQGKLVPPLERFSIKHSGEIPIFDDFDAST